MNRPLTTFSAIERAKWDLIILDEGQENQKLGKRNGPVIKSLRSPFALVLSGTPLENSLDQLYFVVKKLTIGAWGLLFVFPIATRSLMKRGKVLRYKNLDELRERLKPVLTRRTRKSVMTELHRGLRKSGEYPDEKNSWASSNAQMEFIS